MPTERHNDAMGPRERLVLFLSFFSSRTCHRACFPSLSTEHIAYELCRLWFDEVFIPGIRYLDSYKGDYNHEAAEQFRAAFSGEEWNHITRFHRFLELRIDMMPDSPRKERRLPNNNLWESMTRDAANLLELLEPCAEKRHLVTDSLERRVQSGSSDSMFLLLGQESPA